MTTAAVRLARAILALVAAMESDDGTLRAAATVRAARGEVLESHRVLRAMMEGR